MYFVSNWYNKLQLEYLYEGKQRRILKYERVLERQTMGSEYKRETLFAVIKNVSAGR